jgi:hypothetical protein
MTGEPAPFFFIQVFFLLIPTDAMAGSAGYLENLHGF